MVVDELFLNDCYNIYFHCPYSTDWTISSYVNIGSISSVEDYWLFDELIKKHLPNGMFFYMKSECFPIWDDISNKDGGVLCIKVLKSELNSYWSELCISMFGNTLLKPEYSDVGFDDINGISFSPKKSFVICKIWLRSDKYSDAKYFNIPSGYHGDIIYKSNIENITKPK